MAAAGYLVTLRLLSSKRVVLFMEKINTKELSTQDRILSAAKLCFSKQGFHSTSMKHICQTCNLSPGTLYHHFPSKEALIQAIIFEAQKRALIRLSEPLNGMSLIDYIIESTQSLADEDHNERALVVEIMAEGMRNPQVAEMLKKKYMIIAASIIERFNDAQANNEMRQTVNKEISARLLMALVYGIMSDSQSQEYLRHEDYPATLRNILAGIL